MLWDAATARAVATFSAHADSVTGVAISADGRLVVSTSRDGKVKFWPIDGTVEP
jgi:WD40 repeat protein